MKKKVLVTLGIMMLAFATGCGGEKETKQDAKEAVTDTEQGAEASKTEDGNSDFKGDVLNSEKSLLHTSFEIKCPNDWICSMGDSNFAYTNKGTTFLIAGDGIYADDIEAWSELNDLPNACMNNADHLVYGNYPTTKYNPGSTKTIVSQEQVTINGIDMVKTTGKIKDTMEENLEHNFIGYYTIHEANRENPNKYPVYFIYFYPDDADAAQIEAYAEASAETLELRTVE